VRGTVIAFSIPAALLTVMPGLDTALVVRTAAIEGSRRAMFAGSGVVSASSGG
jgi:threonine/homoserine/homoserine lactone efflux protein